MDELDKKKQSTTEELLAINRKEAKKQDGLNRQLKDLKTALEAEKKEIASRKSAFKELKAEFDKMQESYRRKKEKVGRAHSDITSLQQSIKDKDTIMDKMKLAGSELKQQYLSAKKSVKDLSDDNKGLNQRIQAVEERAQNLESLLAERQVNKSSTIPEAQASEYKQRCYTDGWTFSEGLSKHTDELPNASCDRSNSVININ